MLDIKRNKGNQTTKIAQLARYNMRKFFFKIHAENELVRLVPDLFLFFRKTYMKQKQVVSTLLLKCFGSSSFGHTIKTNCSKL